MFLNQALEVADLDTLRKLTEESTPPRYPGGIYFVATGIGGGKPQWFQWLAASTAPEVPGVYKALTSGGVPIDTAGRWVSFSPGVIPQGTLAPNTFFGGPPQIGPGEVQLYFQVNGATRRLWVGFDSTGIAGTQGWTQLTTNFT